MAFVNDMPGEIERRPTDTTEYRVATPRADLVVVRRGKSKSKSGTPLRDTEKSGALIDGIARVTRKPGISRDIVFKSRRGKRVYAYSVYPADTTKIVREDAEGRKTLGRLVHGEFKALRSKTV